MERLAATADKTTSHFSFKLDVFSTNCRPLVNSAPSLHSHPAIKERIQTLHKAINDFTEIADAAAATSTSSSPSTTSTGDTHKDRPRMAPLNLDILKFSGDLLQWEAFELGLLSLLKHRAEGFSEADKIAIVKQAIVPSQGKSLIADLLKQGASIDKLLDDLRRMFGRPQLMIPILVQKVSEPPRADQSASSLRKFKVSVLDNYRALNNHVKGDLGLFMPHFLRPFLDGKLREDWERLLKYPSPTMTDFTEFIEQRLLWADTHSLSTPSTMSATSTSSTSFNPTYTPTSPRKKPPTMPAKCASCGETHWLSRCSVFAALSTEERNRLVWEKWLCLNCLSPAHAVRSCTNRHSCRHCLGEMALSELSLPSPRRSELHKPPLMSALQLEASLTATQGAANKQQFLYYNHDNHACLYGCGQPTYRDPSFSTRL